MEPTSLFSSSGLPSLSIPCKQLTTGILKFGHIRRSSHSHSTALHSSRREPCNWNSNDNGYGELLVDESMIVLRKRIHEMKMIERNYEPPEEWMDWEKQWYASYDQFICKFVGLLQMHLMSTRPSLALGMIFLITMSLPISAIMIALHLMEAGNGVISTLHFG
ncbi:uncharacterized protein LOC8268624 [Ricinus communis]|uniref:Uncharacterized protein n=1 Tax=Ricinus communis TaxID=3988 RepID=B9T319_RICCO|nr:uncharacterized protein LOC8268624 [Ricinus communis]EEF29741.1 conserved hypothetical protein [Ricinus communis]|eukprot:XP_015583001.1 uncharacterized protein LOC8268624 [Ricinus communis]